MSQGAMFGDTDSVTSLPASAGGRMPSDLPDGQTSGKCGQVPVRASRSRSRVVVSQLKMSGIYGLSSGGSSASAVLQQSLASRLAQSLDCNGSMEYSLTWNDVAMPSREPICALRASARPISASGFTGWATPRTITGGPESAQRKQELGRTESGGGDLQAQAQLAGWPTCRAEDSESTGAHRGVPDTLTSAARLAGWPTPDTALGGHTSRGRERKDEPLIGGLLRGLPLSAPAATGKRGVLASWLPMWLMGYPIAWNWAGKRAWLACRSSRKRKRAE